MSKLKRLIWALLTVINAASANFAFHDDEDFRDQSERFKREASGDYDSSGDGSEVSLRFVL